MNTDQFALTPSTEMGTSRRKTKPSDPSKNHEGSGTRKFKVQSYATRPSEFVGHGTVRTPKPRPFKPKL
jgi:hypothetical protein